MNKIFKLVTGFAATLILLTACTTGIDGPSMPPIPEGEDNSPGETEMEQELDSLDDQAEILMIEGSDQETSIRVLWRLIDYVLAGSFQGEENKAREKLFLTLDINESEIYFDGQVCVGVKFQKETVDTADYLSSAWQTLPEALGIAEFQQVQVIKTNCSLFGFNEYLRLGDSRLIVREGDAFYFFEPVFN